MRVAVYGCVLVIALGSVLLGLDWCSAPMSPMVDTEAGLRAAPAPVAVQRPPVIPSATIGAPIVPPGLSAPVARTPAPAAATQAAAPPVEAEPQVRCNIDACTAAYHSFRATDCTYLPISGPRRLCTK
jgi:penicillin-binding protein 1A